MSDKSKIGLIGTGRIDVDPNGGMEIDHDFFVDFHDRPEGPARTHEVRLQGGDCTTEIFQ